jgi:hypothetical protein
MATTCTTIHHPPASTSPARRAVLALLGALLITIAAGTLLVALAGAPAGSGIAPATITAHVARAEPGTMRLLPMSAAAGARRSASGDTTDRLTVSVGHEGRGYRLHLRLAEIDTVWKIIAEGTI